MEERVFIWLQVRGMIVILKQYLLFCPPITWNQFIINHAYYFTTNKYSSTLQLFDDKQTSYTFCPIHIMWIYTGIRFRRIIVIDPQIVFKIKIINIIYKPIKIIHINKYIGISI
jgi:hypothetical protein